MPASTPSPDGRGRRRLLVALAVALGVHAGMLLVPWCGELPDAEAPPRVTRLRLTPPEPPTPRPEVEPPDRDRTPEPPQVAEAAPEPPPPEETAERPTPPAEQELAEAPAEPESQARPESEPPPDESVAALPRGPELFPRQAIEDGREGAAPPEGGPDWSLSQRDPRDDPNEGAEGRIKQRVTRWSEDTKAVDRVRVGLYDPYFVRLRERMDATFDPDWEAFDPDDEGGIVDTLKSWLGTYQAAAERYAETGTPYHEGETNTDAYVPPINDARPAGTRAVNDPAYVADAAALWRDIVHGKAGGVEVATLVRITQEPDGTLVRVDFEQRSGRPVYDRLVLESITQALEGAPPPQREGEGLGLTGKNIVSVWKFRTRFGMAPVGQAFAGGNTEAGGPGVAGLPTFGCDLGGGECYWPFKRLVHPNLELVAVY